MENYEVRKNNKKKLRKNKNDQSKISENSRFFVYGKLDQDIIDRQFNYLDDLILRCFETISISL